MKAKIYNWLIYVTQEKKVWYGAVLISSYIVATRLDDYNLNPSGGIYNFVFLTTSLFSALVAFTVIAPFCMEITQPGLPCSGVHK